MAKKKNENKQDVRSTEVLYLYSNKEIQQLNEFAGGISSISRDTFVSKTQSLHNITNENAKELEKVYNSMLKKINANDDSSKRLKEMLVNALNKHISKFQATVNSNNILQAFSAAGGNSADELFQYIKDEVGEDLKKLKYFEKDQTRVSQAVVERNLKEIERRLKKILAETDKQNAKQAHEEALKLQQELESIREKIRVISKDETTEQFFRTTKVNEKNAISIQQLNDLARAVDSCSKVIALANGDIGEILGHMLVSLSALDIKTIGEKEIDDFFSKAFANMKEQGASYSNIVGENKQTEEIFTGAELLNLGDGNNIKIRKHRGKTDITIEYAFKKSGKKDVNLSIKNYASFKNLTLVDGTPLDVVIRYISASQNKKLLLNSLLSFTEESKIQEKRKDLKEALKARIFQNAFQGYGEAIINGKSQGFAEVFTVFNNNTQKVRCISIPYAIKQFVEKNDSKKNNLVSIKLNEKDIPDNFTVMSAPNEKIVDQKAEREKLYNRLNTYKIHVSLTDLEQFLGRQKGKK